jgi:hypothetical protein
MRSAKNLRLAGVICLVAGIVSAVIIYAVAKTDEPLGIMGVDIPTNRDRLYLERMGGKSYVLLHDFTDWFGSLWHGQRLAYTIGVLAIGGFLASRWLADLVSQARADEPTDRR